jgi:hypothetical protein
MALVSAVDLRALHSTSNQISNVIKNLTSLSSYGPRLWETPRYLQASSKEFEPVIPSPQIFDGLWASEKGDPLPSAAACAIHLEFLAALHEFRQRVLESEELDKLFGTEVKKKTVVRQGITVELKDDTLAQRRQVKWEKFVEIAVMRFEIWWRSGGPDGQDGVHGSDALLPPLGRSAGVSCRGRSNVGRRRVDGLAFIFAEPAMVQKRGKEFDKPDTLSIRFSVASNSKSACQLRIVIQ